MSHILFIVRWGHAVKLIYNIQIELVCILVKCMFSFKYYNCNTLSLLLLESCFVFLQIFKEEEFSPCRKVLSCAEVCFQIGSMNEAVLILKSKSELYLCQDHQFVQLKTNYFIWRCGAVIARSYVNIFVFLLGTMSTLPIWCL
jgi:hypothetical protein